MNLQTRINTLVELNNVLENKQTEFQQIKQEAYYHNKWFVLDNVNKAIESIQSTFLDRSKLINWTSNYNISDKNTQKSIGIIMAGNIPLVGFHDMISVFLSGHSAKIKLSSKDDILMKFIIDQLFLIEPEIQNLIQIEERIKDINAVIATGSNNSFKYFEYYFGKKPNLLRKNRNGTAILTGDESDKDLQELAKDIFDYFGLGCRNISKIYVPDNYDFPKSLKIFDENQDLKQHNKYMNNYDYNLAIAMLNKDKIYQGEVVFLKEDISYLSRIANVHYEYYSSLEEIKKRIQNDSELIQVATTKTGKLLNFEREVAFGKTQTPALNDYSDGVDVMKFLIEL